MDTFELTLVILVSIYLILLGSWVVWITKGVQGPERHLVGDVAERQHRPDGVEETQSGRRDVGEIVGATELREYVEREIFEAWRQWVFTPSYWPFGKTGKYYKGKVAALVELQEWIDSRTAKRSDLSNAEPSYGDGEKRMMNPK